MVHRSITVLLPWWPMIAGQTQRVKPGASWVIQIRALLLLWQFIHYIHHLFSSPLLILDLNLSWPCSGLDFLLAFALFIDIWLWPAFFSFNYLSFDLFLLSLLNKPYKSPLTYHWYNMQCIRASLLLWQFVHCIHHLFLSPSLFLDLSLSWPCFGLGFLLACQDWLQ